MNPYREPANDADDKQIKTKKLLVDVVYITSEGYRSVKKEFISSVELWPDGKAYHSNPRGAFYDWLKASSNLGIYDLNDNLSIPLNRLYEFNLVEEDTYVKPRMMNYKSNNEF